MNWTRDAKSEGVASRRVGGAVVLAIDLSPFEMMTGDKLAHLFTAQSLAVRRLCMLLAILSIGVVSPMAEEITRSTFDGISLDEPIRIRMRGTQILVPAGFLAPWPSQKMRNVVNDLEGINFNFWMPERRYVEIDDRSLTDFQPKEPGRYQSSSEPFVVKVRPLQLLRPDELDFRSPEKRFKNFTSIPSPSSYSFKEEEFGLVRFWRNDWPHKQPEPFLNYKHVDGTDPQILLRCTPPDRTPTNPLCDGYVYSVANEISFHVYFPRQKLPQWRKSVLAVLDLFNSWKAPSN